MQRRYNRELFKSRVEKIKALMPDAFIGVDVIVGFPGETDEDFSEAYRFLKDLDTSFYHVFSYSERPNTKSATFEYKVPHNIITKRSKELHKLTNEKQLSFYKMHLGKEAMALFESSKKDGLMFGFTENYIKVETKYDRNLIGEIVKVKLVDVPENGNVKVKIL
jgi:threonylcarbamoyladenosine tRNA methylthiotransferase MtaB